MALETNLQAMARHLANRLDFAKNEIVVDKNNLPAFARAQYGEPRVITEWPFLSVQPQTKFRELRATRKFGLTFTIWVVIYHGEVSSTLEIQEGAHRRIEAVEDFLQTDLKWNFVDSDDTDLDKVIFGFATFIDHPIVLAPEEKLWSASRLELTASSQEFF